MSCFEIILLYCTVEGTNKAIVTTHVCLCVCVYVCVCVFVHEVWGDCAQYFLSYSLS